MTSTAWTNAACGRLVIAGQNVTCWKPYTTGYWWWLLWRIDSRVVKTERGQPWQDWQSFLKILIFNWDVIGRLIIVLDPAGSHFRHLFVPCEGPSSTNHKNGNLFILFFFPLFPFFTIPSDETMDWYSVSYCPFGKPEYEWKWSKYRD